MSRPIRYDITVTSPQFTMRGFSEAVAQDRAQDRARARARHGARITTCCW